MPPVPPVPRWRKWGRDEPEDPEAHRPARRGIIQSVVLAKVLAFPDGRQIADGAFRPPVKCQAGVEAAALSAQETTKLAHDFADNAVKYKKIIEKYSNQ